MAVSLHYYNGDCSSPETQAQIQKNFIEILNGSLFNDICRDGAFQDKCKAENVKVTCSNVDPVRKRKKRASGKLSLLSFEISTYYDPVTRLCILFIYINQHNLGSQSNDNLQCVVKVLSKKDYSDWFSSRFC